MEESYGEGVATHTGPESCAVDPFATAQQAVLARLNDKERWSPGALADRIHDSHPTTGCRRSRRSTTRWRRRGPAPFPSQSPLPAGYLLGAVGLSYLFIGLARRPKKE